MVRLTKKEEDEDDVGCSRARGTCHPIERGRECKVNKWDQSRQSDDDHFYAAFENKEKS